MKKLLTAIAMVMALVFIGAAFAPAALAVSYAPYDWSRWPQQRRYDYDIRYTYAIQRFLRDRYNLHDSQMETDGIFGPDTEEWVKQFQRDNGLSVDGIVGTETWKKMRARIYCTHTTGQTQGIDIGEEPKGINITQYYMVYTHDGPLSSNGTAFEYSRRLERWSVMLNSGAWKTIYS